MFGWFNYNLYFCVKITQDERKEEENCSYGREFQPSYIGTLQADEGGS